MTHLSKSTEFPVVRLPVGFVPTKYNGYFWDFHKQKLYSIKVGGLLKALVRQMPNRFNKADYPFYHVSVNGRKRRLYEDYLKSLTLLEEDHIIGEIR